MNALEDFRARKDEYYRTGDGSPLDRIQRKLFQGLAYFLENPDLIVIASLREPDDAGEVGLETSTGDRQIYRRAGTVEFTVDGEPAQITLFQSDHDEQFFVPFRDATSGRESYAAGRYLEVDPPHDHQVVVDFNFAYNPYCAYSAHWSCPLPPVENWLAVPIRAGEMDYTGRADH